MPRIAFLFYYGEKFGGMERRYARLVKHLISEGLDVVVYATRETFDGLKSSDIEIPHQRIIDIEGKFFISRLPRKIKRILGLIHFIFLVRWNKIDRIHVASNPGLITGILAKADSFLPPISASMVDSFLTATELDIRRLSNWHSIECLSPRISEYVCQHLKNIDSKVDVSTAPCSFIDYSKVIEEGHRHIDVLMIARFTPGKGYELLEKAASKIKEYNMHLCGFGKHIPNVRAAKIYECKDPFAICGQAKIFLSLQEKNNYPSQALMEAMASGCAIIATDVGETRLLLDESCAIIIPPKPCALANAITLLMSDDSRRVRLGQAAKNRVEKSHNIQRYSEYFVQNILKV